MRQTNQVLVYNEEGTSEATKGKHESTAEAGVHKVHWSTSLQRIALKHGLDARKAPTDKHAFM